MLEENPPPTIGKVAYISSPKRLTHPFVFISFCWMCLCFSLY